MPRRDREPPASVLNTMLKDLRDQQEVVTKCLRCRKKHTGTALEGRAWHKTHRRTCQ